MVHASVVLFKWLWKLNVLVHMSLYRVTDRNLPCFFQLIDRSCSGPKTRFSLHVAAYVHSNFFQIFTFFITWHIFMLFKVFLKTYISIWRSMFYFNSYSTTNFLVRVYRDPGISGQNYYRQQINKNMEDFCQSPCIYLSF